MTKIEITTFILALAGSLAWVPYIISLFKRAVIKGRMIGLTVSPDFNFSVRNHFNNSDEVIKGIGYFPKFTFVSLNKDFNVERVNVSVKFPGESELREGIVFISSKTAITFQEDETNKFLNIPVKEHISSLLIFEHGKQVPVFIPFGITRPTYEHFEYIKIKFTDFNGREQVVIFNKSDIDVKTLVFEEKYWSAD